ncbi:MAG TPA: penicillin acylase family protein [Steroidobacteraceae bacterium]|nr:penicillin acylase family protein [Steroidobacteraceae bacterium]
MKRFLVALIALVAIALTTLAVTLRGSLPQLDGSLETAGFAAPVEIERDELGVPTLHAATRADLAFATGFVHAQDRFFQMDLLRSAAAGRLAELLGPGLVATDKRLRVHGFEHVAEEVIRTLPRDHRAVLEAYAAGVNAALSDLRVRPPEYLLLRVAPRAWSPIDSILVAHAMFLDLQDSTGSREIATARLRATLPPELVRFLEPRGSEWDAPLIGGPVGPEPIPGPDVFDLRRVQTTAASAATGSIEDRYDDVAVGSNNWAVAGTHTDTGAAMLANDMHLGLRIPNVWYRARLIVTSDAKSAAIDMTGVTLPGTPVLIAGSNGRVAWGYTNSYGDWSDVVLIEPDPRHPNRYLTSAGPREYDVRVEQIAASGTDEVATLEVRTTIWGPVIGELDGRAIALAWTAHRPRASNLRHLDLEHVTNVEQALEVANSIGAPVQNFVAADANGRIGWTLMGQVPVRRGYDPTAPASWREDAVGWIGWREPGDYPRIVDPLAGRLWTANARVLDPAQLDFIGDGGYARGARAGQIRDQLFELERASIADMARIQLDDRALFLTRWRDLLLELLEQDVLEAHPLRAAARKLVTDWSGRASVDDAGYRIVRAFRLAVVDGVHAVLTTPVRNEYPGFVLEPSPQFEGSVWQLVTQRPDHLLAPDHERWSEWLLDALDAALVELSRDCPDLSDCTWGERNRLTMGHPIANAVPMLSRWLSMPAIPLPGDGDMPRVQGPAFGASERFAVSPGREQEGFFQMPGGQSGHPLSPFYRAGHDAWISGAQSPFLPGPPEHRLRLEPRVEH